MSDNQPVDAQPQVFLPGEDWSGADLSRPLFLVGEPVGELPEPPDWSCWEDCGLTDA